jgi:hypothetical protein
MAVPTDKTALINAIQINYGKLKKELITIPVELTVSKELEGHSKGTQMSLHNLVAYLVGWGELVLKWNQKMDAGEAVDFPETGYKWNELGKLAQQFYSDYEQVDWTVLLQQLDQMVNRILELIECKTNTELYEQSWYGKWTLGRMIQFNTASPYTNASGRIRKWKTARKLS